jgi:hypothetical protein
MMDFSLCESMLLISSYLAELAAACAPCYQLEELEELTHVLAAFSIKAPLPSICYALHNMKGYLGVAQQRLSNAGTSYCVLYSFWALQMQHCLHITTQSRKLRPAGRARRCSASGRTAWTR